MVKKMANEKRLIDANDLITKIQGTVSEVARKAPYDPDWFIRLAERQFEILNIIDDQPEVDAVEVVRCKDCKHFTEGMAVGMCKRIPDKPIIPIVYNHFCSYGERRTDNA